MDRPTSLKPDRSDYLAIIASLAIALVMGAISFAPAALAESATQVTAETTRIVRAVHGTSCDARVIGSEGEPGVKPGEDLESLSVSCSDDPSVTWEMLRQPLPRSHACTVVLGELRQLRGSVRLLRAPSATNPHQCRLSRVTPNQFVSRASWQQ